MTVPASRSSSEITAVSEPPAETRAMPALSAVVSAASTGNQESQDDGKEEHDYLTGTRLFLACAALNLSTIIMFLDNSILSTATPTITNEFRSVKDIGWYVSAYQLASSALQPTTGKLFTYFTNKWTYITFVLIFEFGSLICALSNSSLMLILGRAVAGIGSSGLFNGALTIVTAMVPLQRRPAMLGLLIGISQLGMIAGPLIGGSLTEFTTWRWCFYINLPIGGCAVLMLVLVHIPEQCAKRRFREVLSDKDVLRKFDVVGTLLLIPAVVMLLLALHFGGSEYPWDSATVLGLFCGSGGTALLFLAWEHRAGEAAMIPLGIFRNRVVAAGCLLNLCLFGCAFVGAYFVPIYFQSILGDSPFMSGVHLLPQILSQLLVGVAVGFIVSKLGYYLPWALFSGTLTPIGAGLITTWSRTTSTAKWVGYQIMYGAGRGAGVQISLVAIQCVLPQSQIAVSMAILVFLQGLGSAIFISISNTIFDTSLSALVAKNAPGVDVEAVIAAGATAYREVVPAADLAAVVDAYAESFGRTFYLVVGLASCIFLFACGLGNHDVRKTAQPEKGGGAVVRRLEEPRGEGEKV